jgi:hypothetical protein
MGLEIVGRRRADQPATNVQREPRTLTNAMRGAGETALTMATGAVAEPLAGLYGLATTPFQGAASGAANVESARTAMTYMPRTETGQRYLQNIGEFVAPVTSRMESANKYLGEKGYEARGPIGGAIGSSLLTAAAELIPGGMAARQLRMQNAPAPSMSPSQAPAPARIRDQVADPSPIVEASAVNIDRALPDIRAGRTETLAAQVVPDLQIMKDAEALGISLNPEHYSTSRAFIDMQEALKSRPGSRLSINEDKAISDLGRQADQLISDFGGYTDRDLLQQQVQSTFQNTINGLKKNSKLLYDSVDAVIPADAKVIPSITLNYMNEQIRRMGGEEGLSLQEKTLFDLINGDAPPTYARFDRERKLVGMALDGKDSVYSSIPQADLKRIYKAMSDEQVKFADAFGVGDDLRDANRLVTQRKDIEDASIALLGRELQNSIIPKLTGAASGLTRGDVMKLRNLMEALPEELRAQASATMLGDLFVAGGRRSSEMSGGFMNTFSALNRNATAKEALFMYLPIDARERFDMIGRVATGIYRAKNLENKSRTARDVIAALESGGLLSKMYGTASDIAKAEGVGTVVGAPGVGTAAVVANKITSKATPAVEAADQLLSSPVFRQAVQNHMSGATDQADALLRSTPEYKKWLSAQNGTIRAEVTAIGIIPWLTTDRQEQQ